MTSLFSACVLAQQAVPAPQEAPPTWTMFVPMIVIVVLFYFLMIVPQRREQKKRESLLSALKKDDRVVTIGGIFGTVANVLPNEVVLKVDDNVRVRVRRSAIAEVLNAEAKDEAKPA